MKLISCKEAVDYMLKKEEGKLTFLQKLSLWRHFTICSLCRIFYRQNKLVNQTLRQRQDGVRRLSDDEKKNIIQNVLNKND